MQVASKNKKVILKHTHFQKWGDVMQPDSKQNYTYDPIVNYFL